MSEVDAIVALGGDFSPEGGLGRVTLARMRVAVSLVNSGISKHLIVTGKHSFSETAKELPLAQLMENYAHHEGVEDVFRVDDSLDTIGDAVHAKQQVIVPRQWKNLRVVTSGSHMPRSLQIFGHVMGGGYEIGPEEAPDVESEYPHSRLHEWAGNMLMKIVLAGTEPGDDEHIKKRLYAIVPGYADVPFLSRLSVAASGILR